MNIIDECKTFDDLLETLVLKRRWLKSPRLVIEGGSHEPITMRIEHSPIIPSSIVLFVDEKTRSAKACESFSGIDRSVMNDIETAKMRRDMKTSAKRSADFLSEYFRRLRRGENPMDIYVDMVGTIKKRS